MGICLPYLAMRLMNKEKAVFCVMSEARCGKAEHVTEEKITIQKRRLQCRRAEWKTNLSGGGEGPTRRQRFIALVVLQRDCLIAVRAQIHGFF